MKTRNLLIAIIFIAGSVFAQTVAEQEVRITGNIRFLNNEGIPEKIETADQIRGIGISLGRDANRAERQYFGRYRILHIVDPSEKGLFDSDILILEKSAAVDHIRNLRFIIAGYLNTAYGYSAADSRLLAEFITVYNAVYRKDMNYFRSKYKKAVVSRLDADKAGLSVNWKEWPGLTQILIPLDDGRRGSLSAVDTGAITDKKVVEELRKQDDMSIEARKDMVDLKERQIDQQQDKAATERQQLRDDQRELSQRERELAQRQQQAERDARTAATEQQRQEAARKQEEVKQEQAKAAEDKKALEERQQAAAKEEAKIAEKKEEVREDRKEIAKDQGTVLEREAAAALRGIPFIKVQSGAKGNLLLVDPRTGEELSDTAKQPVTIRSYESFGGGIAVILQRSGSDSGRLCVLERGSLKERISAREEIYGESNFQVNGAELFVVIRDEGKWYLGKYDSRLGLLARSKAEVNPGTFILFSDAHVFVETPGGKVVPLKLGDMQ